MESDDTITNFEALNALDDLCLIPNSDFRNQKIITKLKNSNFIPIVKKTVEKLNKKLKNKKIDKEERENFENLKKYAIFINSYLKK